MVDRIVRAIRLDWTVFREIAEDENAMKEAAIIVVVVSFLSAIGGGIGSGNFIVSFLVGWILAILVGWIGWAILTYLVGTLLFSGKSNIPEMMRVLGYASAPKLLGLFGFIPCVGWILVLAGWLLSLIAGFIAVREAMDFDTVEAIVTVLISGVIVSFITVVIGLILGVGMAATASVFG
ncbi:YIP1 family protein [Chloroflexota bacterium]